MAPTSADDKRLAIIYRRRGRISPDARNVSRPEKYNKPGDKIANAREVGKRNTFEKPSGRRRHRHQPPLATAG